MHFEKQAEGGLTLKTPEERVKLLKAGFEGKTIEMLYIKYNNFKIAGIPLVLELVEFDIPEKISIDHFAAAEYT